MAQAEDIPMSLADVVDQLEWSLMSLPNCEEFDQPIKWKLINRVGIDESLLLNVQILPNPATSTLNFMGKIQARLV